MLNEKNIDNLKKEIDDLLDKCEDDLKRWRLIQITHLNCL